MTALGPADMARWRKDPTAFMQEVLVDPETGAPFVLNAAEKRFLKHAFKRTRDGRLRHPEQVYAAPKKSGKTGFGAMVLLYTVLVLGGRYAEGVCCANDLEQSSGRVYLAAKRIVECSPLLADETDGKPSSTKITFGETGATVTAIASDFAGAAGGAHNVVVFDELWAYTSEAARRLFDEMVPVPTRQVSFRLTVTYAGFQDESELLEDLYKRGMKGRRLGPDLYATEDGLLMFWTHKPVAPWQTAAWLAQMRGALRPNQYMRMIENQWVSNEGEFVPIEWWDRCADPEARPLVKEPSLPVWLGVDASVKRDSTAIVACAWDDETHRVRLIWHRIFRPSKSDPLDFEATIEETLLDLKSRFHLRAVNYDPWQMQAVAQRLIKAGVPMEEFPQSVPRLTESSTNLYELLRGRGLSVYPDDEIRLAVQRSIAIETTRGWRIAKERASYKIDCVVALAMAAHGAVKQGQKKPLDLGSLDLSINSELTRVNPFLV